MGVERAVWIERIDVAEASARHFVRFICVLLGVRHVNLAAQRRDVERRVTGDGLRVDEHGRDNGRVRLVEHIERTCMEVRRDQHRIGAADQRQSFVRGSIRRHVCLDDGSRPGLPARDQAIFGGENELIGLEARRGVEHLPGWRASFARRRRGNRHDERRRSAVSRVHGRDAAVGRRNPKHRSYCGIRIERDAPGIDEVGVGEGSTLSAAGSTGSARSAHGLTEDEVGLDDHRAGRQRRAATGTGTAFFGYASG